MSIKSKVLTKINKDAQKIRDRRASAANKKTVEAAAFEFFGNAEQAELVTDGKGYDPILLEAARKSFEGRIRRIDSKVKVSIEFNAREDLTDWSVQQVRGVTVWWSQAYIAKNNVDPSLYTDVSQMLFL